VNDKLRKLPYNGHHNVGALHLAADVAVIASIATTVGVILALVVLLVIAVVIVAS
jgi:hypothetical protein